MTWSWLRAMETVMNTFSGSILWVRLGGSINSSATNIFKYQSLMPIHLFISLNKSFVPFPAYVPPFPPMIFCLRFSEPFCLFRSNAKRYGSSWLQFFSLLPSALPREPRRKCKDCKHIDCLATEDRLPPRWSPTASPSRFSFRGGKEYHLLSLSWESLCLPPSGSRRPVSEPTSRYLATATLFITSSCFAERSLCREGGVYQLERIPSEPFISGIAFGLSLSLSS